uniref:Uncharacterized protein n=1 Tax=Lepeophtheirus salmonis TaxID=72036 RepID=A0A0K2TNZ8_LEPSM
MMSHTLPPNKTLGSNFIFLNKIQRVHLKDA